MQRLLSGESFHPPSQHWRRTSRLHRTCLLAAFLIGAVMAASPARGEEKVRVGGWAGFVYSDNDTDGNLRGFDAHPWYFYIQAEPVEGFKFFGEIEAEHVFKFKGGTSSASGSGELKLERLYLERNFDTAHNARAGKTFVPFGYWYRLHWHFLTETLSRPYSFNNAYSPRFQVGLQYFGRAFVGDTDFNYYAWVGDGPDQFGTNKRTTDAFGYGASGYVVHKIGGSRSRTIGATLGLHAQTIGDGPLEEDQTNYVVGVEGKIARGEFRAEYYSHDRDLSEDFSSWYANALVWIDKRFGFNARYDSGDDLKGSKSTTNPEADSLSLGLLWRPYARVLVKTEYRQNDFDDPLAVDFDEWNLFLALKY